MSMPSNFVVNLYYIITTEHLATPIVWVSKDREVAIAKFRGMILPSEFNSWDGWSPITKHMSNGDSIAFSTQEVVVRIEIPDWFEKSMNILETYRSLITSEEYEVIEKFINLGGRT